MSSSSEEENTPKRRKTESPAPKAVEEQNDDDHEQDHEESDAGQRRLLITKMVLENFKSYAGKQEIGPFHHCFTSTVGPNGSGKSNVIDAMLFVFGKRAKQLRLNKIRELIHKSDQCTPSFATVTVYMHEIIDRPDRNNAETNDEMENNNNGTENALPYDIVPGSEVVLSRTAKSDNTSIYKLNGQKAQFKEIAAFLKTKGIDLEHNRFLILQGEVELISMMPPKGKNEGDNDGLLEYLEDIIGSHTFVPATLEAEAKVEELTVIRQEKLNRVKAGETETKALESAKQEAQTLLRCERDIRQNQNILYQLQRLHVNKKVDNLKEKREDIEAQLEKTREESDQAQAEHQERMDSYNELVKEYDVHLKEFQRTEEDFTAYERRNIDLKEAVKHSKETLKTLKKKVKDQEQKAEKAQEKIDAATERIPQLEEEIQLLEKSKEEEDANLKRVEDETQQKTQGLRSELEVQKQALQPLREDRATKQADLETAQTELQLIENSATEAQSRLEEATQDLSNLDNNQRDKQQELEDTKTNLEGAKKRLVELEKEDGTLANNETEVVERNKNLMTRMEEVKASIQSRGSARIPRAVVEILKAARKGGPLSKVGILGRLGDLATIDARYDIAITTACAGFLHHIVVHTTAGVQRCLDFLRQNNIGRVNFIPLDKMKKSAHDRAVETPENAPRLFDKIQPMPNQNPGSVMSAIYLAVSNTLVAPDLETATRWAFEYKKRWRVVTLDGKLLESAGTMSGGGNKPSKGGMRLRNSHAAAMADDNDDSLDNESKKIEDEIAKGNEGLAEIRSRRKEIVEAIRKVKRDIKDFERLLPKLTMEINGFDTARENLTNFIPQLKEKCSISEEDQRKIDELKEKVSQCQGEVDDCIAQAANLEKEVKRLQDAILDAGGSKLKKQQGKCESIQKEIKDAQKSLSSSNVAIKSSTKAIKKAHEAKAAAEEQIKECEDTLEQKTKEFESLENDAHAVSDAYDKAKRTEATARTALEKSREEVEKREESLSGFKGKVIELVGQVDAVSKSLAEHEQKIHQWDAAIKKLIKVARKDERELWDDEEEEAEKRMKNSDDVESELKNDNDESGDNDVDMQEEDKVNDQGEDEDDDDDQRDEARLAASYPTYAEASLERYDKDELSERISILETERNTLAKSANLGAIAEYRKKEADYLARVAELDEITEKRNEVRREHEDLRRRRLEMFMEGFSEITLKLKEMYQMITLGGDAELELVDSLDPFSEGIVFSVRPPKKSWKNISNLSGGEKTLSSLALVFALHHYKPTPLYVMDEIDAALDYKNVSIVANYIKERTKNAQFIIISLRNNMFELADRLVGIYKTDNRTKSVTINPDAFGVQTVQNGCTPALRNRTNSKRSTTGESSSTAKPRSSSLLVPTRLAEMDS